MPRGDLTAVRVPSSGYEPAQRPAQRVYGFNSKSADVSPTGSECSTHFSEDSSATRSASAPSPLTKMLRNQSFNLGGGDGLVRPAGLNSLKIGRKSMSCQNLSSLDAPKQQQPDSGGQHNRALRSGSCSMVRHEAGGGHGHPSPSGSCPISIPTPRAPSSGRAGSSMANSQEDYAPFAPPPDYNWLPPSVAQEASTEQQAGGSGGNSPPHRMDSPTRRAWRPAFQRVSPVPELPSDVVFDMEQPTSPTMTGTRSRSQSAAVLTAF